MHNSPSSHYIEWAKKEDCWETIKRQHWDIDYNSIKADFATIEQIKKRKSVVDDLDTDTMQKEYDISLLRSIPYALWKKIAEWGKDTGLQVNNPLPVLTWQMP